MENQGLFLLKILSQISNVFYIIINFVADFTVNLVASIQQSI